MSNPGGSGVVPKQKSKRKISLPWFRQGSVSNQHPALTRQHTIDTPSSFQARLLRRQPSQNALAGVLEMTWVVSDFVASNSQELSVTKGQQVEVVEVCASKPEYCLVRMPTRGTDHDSTAVPEGLVPLSVLKQPPQPRSSPSRRPTADHDADTTGTDNSTGISTSSPVNKRRGFSGRKWLPPPLRKLSQGKVDKTQQSTVDRPQLKKTGSDKRIKVPPEMGNKPSVSEGEDDEDRSSLRGVRSLGAADLANGGGEDGDDEVELPPPMKPIQEPILVTSGPPSSVPTIEENPCKREQHTENQERNSLFRDAKQETETDAGIKDVSSAQCSSNEATAPGFSGDESDKTVNEGPESMSVVEMHLEKRMYVLKELVETEEKYVNDLALIVDGYISAMRDENCEVVMPEPLKCGKDKMVFGNIEVIYEWHKNYFLNELNKCMDQPGELGSLFKRYERKLHMYVVYCKNKPMSEFIVSEYLDTYFEDLRNFLGHKLQICDLLIKPVQRIMKYQLLLKDILKHTERAGIESDAKLLREALHVMTVVPKAANDMMDVGRLQGFDGKITAQGKLLLHGPLIVSDTSASSSTSIGKNKELHTFLFEQNIIFSESSGKKNQFSPPKYYYKTHLPVNKMSMVYNSGQESFVLNSTDPNKSSQQLVCEAPTPELLEQWLSTINAILQTQTDFLKAIQSPIAYQKELTKDAFPFDMPLWDPSSPLRKTVTLPLDNTQPNHDVPKQRKSANVIHKANTIGIPSEAELVTMKENKHKRFFDGFLRHKHKSDPIVPDSSNGDGPKRWPDSHNSTVT